MLTLIWMVGVLTLAIALFHVSAHAKRWGRHLQKPWMVYLTPLVLIACVLVDGLIPAWLWLTVLFVAVMLHGGELCRRYRRLCR